MTNDPLNVTETSSSEYQESSLANAPKRLHLTTRSVLNILSVVTAIIVLAVTTSWWLPALQEAKSRIFPSPPYTGSLIFDLTLSTLTAHALTDGSVVWHRSAIPQNSVFFRDGNILYVVPTGQQQILALRARDGMLLWHQALPTADTIGFVGTTSQNVILRTFTRSSTDGNLIAFTKLTGQNEKTIDHAFMATLDGSGSFLFYCQVQRESHQLIALNALTFQPLWQQTQAGINCLFSSDSTHLIITTVIPASHQVQTTGLTLQTGAILWQSVNSGIPSFNNDDALILESDPTLAATSTNTVTALDPATGMRLWSSDTTIPHDTLLTSLPSCDVQLTATMVTCVDARTGTLRWEVPTAVSLSVRGNWQSSTDRTTLYLADQTQLQAITLASGTIQWHIATASTLTSVLAQGTVLVTNDTHKIIARNTQTGTIQWSIPIAASGQLCQQCS